MLCCLMLAYYPTYGQEKMKHIKTGKDSADTGVDTTKNIRLMLACNLTTPELNRRKAEVLDNLKKRILAKKELLNGFSYQFNGTDDMLDELSSFIKTERQCCSFFDFGLQISGDGSYCWLTITGPEGAKEFIKTELGL